MSDTLVALRQVYSEWLDSAAERALAGKPAPTAAQACDEFARFAFHRGVTVDGGERETRDWAVALAAGVVFYDLPDHINYDQVDPLIAPVCRRINASGWVATGESCQGHPDCPDLIGPWAGNTDPYLRLICRADDLGAMLAALLRACGPDPTQERFRALPLRIQLDGRGEPWWCGIYAYITARTVGERDAGIAAFMDFAERLLPATPHIVRATPTGGNDEASF